MANSNEHDPSKLLDSAIVDSLLGTSTSAPGPEPKALTLSELRAAKRRLDMGVVGKVKDVTFSVNPLSIRLLDSLLARAGVEDLPVTRQPGAIAPVRFTGIEIHEDIAVPIGVLRVREKRVGMDDRVTHYEM